MIGNLIVLLKLDDVVSSAGDSVDDVDSLQMSRCLRVVYPQDMLAVIPGRPYTEYHPTRRLSTGATRTTRSATSSDGDKRWQRNIRARGTGSGR